MKVVGAQRCSERKSNGSSARAGPRARLRVQQGANSIFRLFVLLSLPKEGFDTPAPSWPDRGGCLPFPSLLFALLPFARTFCSSGLTFFLAKSLQFSMFPQPPGSISLGSRKEQRAGREKKLRLIPVGKGEEKKPTVFLGGCAAFKLAGSGAGGRAAGPGRGPHRSAVICCAAPRLTKSCLWV